jgi:hypothetical protein
MKVVTQVAPDGATTVLLAGTINGAAAADIELALASASRLRSPITLDLSRVRLIDRPMLQYLSDAIGRDVRVVNCPDHIAGWFANADAVDVED